MQSLAAQENVDGREEICKKRYKAIIHVKKVHEKSKPRWIRKNPDNDSIV
jgi:hypothetical protein